MDQDCDIVQVFQEQLDEILLASQPKEVLAPIAQKRAKQDKEKAHVLK